jgi:hypothetical protein
MPNKLSLIPEQQINDLGWNQYEGNPYNPNTINDITDNIGKIEVPVTSIPSPFAQMHLFETSFEFVNKAFEESSRNPSSDISLLGGSTTYHKNVSRCLDVFELLFRFETLKLKNQITLKQWDIDELDYLIQDNNLGMKTFGETLKVFINNYNNDSRFTQQGLSNVFNSFLLIYHKNTIIAGTSPYTGFFTVSDNIPQTIMNEDNRAFFSNNLPLFERKLDFQRFMNILFLSNAMLVESFKEVYAYIRNCNLMSQFEELKRTFSPDQVSRSLESYINLEINNQEVTFLNGNVFFLCNEYNKEDDEVIAKNSDYVIKTSKQLERPPLAISSKGAKSRWNYLNGISFPEDVDTTSNVAIENRQLPGSVIEYPWVNRNDFLSRHLTQLTYNVNKSKFWLPQGDVNDIILPITSKYFDYFTIEDLKKQLTIEKLKLGAIVVTLKIPIVSKNERGKGIIKFERVYDHVVPETIDSDENGAIIKSTLAFGIYPFFKVSDATYNDRYKAFIYHKKKEEINCQFLRQSTSKPQTDRVEISQISRTRKDEVYPSISNYIDISSIQYDRKGELVYKKGKNVSFDIVGFKIENIDLNIEFEGSIIPLMGESIQLSDSSTSIAFDIGTSNSFVAYKTTGTVENLSSYKGKENRINPNLVLLNESTSQSENYRKFDLSSFDAIYGVLQDAEFLPSLVGNESFFKFPIRSIINIDNDAKAEEPGNLNVLSNANIPFAFGQTNLRYNLDNLHSNIKWGVTNKDNNAAQNKLRVFIEELVWLGRNKLLSEGFNPENASVLWFKPLSMSSNQMTLFSIIWKELYSAYFTKSDDSHRLISITESWAPYYSYPNDFGAGRVFMNLDIGGGTTDLVVFENETPILTTSFRFAGNNLFESRNKNKPFDNGFVTRYEADMLKYFGGSLKSEETIRYIKDSEGLQSTDLISYFFNFKEFGKKLSLDGEFKLLFLIHNAAIFYHSFQMLKMIESPHLPNYIGLSGNGAKLVEITNGSTDLNKAKGISSIASLILKEIFELEEIHPLEIRMLKKPKESTAIGGIDGLDSIKNKKHADIDNYYISIGTKDGIVKGYDAVAKQAYKYADVEKGKNSIIEDVTQNVEGFFTYFFDKLWYEANVVQNFGIDKEYNTEALKKFFTNTNNISNTILDAVKNKIHSEKETFINDTLFFEAIKAYLYVFSKYVVTDKINDFKGS